MEFNPKVLERYYKHLYCAITRYGIEYTVSFLDKNGNTEAWFSCWMDQGKLKAQVREYLSCPPKERKHWERYRLTPDGPEEREARVDKP